MSTPALSVLMPLRNEAEHLEAALASLARQSFSDFELIAVDDGSTDDSPNILAQAEKRDLRIRVLTRPAQGLVEALNFGLQQCRAPLVARMDADDICHPARFERQLAHLRAHPEASLVACGFRHFPRPGITDGMLAYERWQNELIHHDDIRRSLFVESPFAHPAVLFRKDAVFAVGGYRATSWAEDYDLWLRLALAGYRFEKLPEQLLLWRDRPERLTRTATTCTLESFRLCKAHHLRASFLKGAQSVTLWGAGKEGKAWRRALKKEGIGVHRWVEVHPGRIGQRIHGAPVVSYETLRPGSGPILICIGTRGAREKVRAWANDNGFIEEKDYLCVT